MKVKDFNPDEFIAEKLEGFRKQEEMLHRLYGHALQAAPEARIDVSWYGLSQHVLIRLYGKDVVKDAPNGMAEQGIELTKNFAEDRGEFDYSFQDGIGSIAFSALPPNCKIVKKTKVVPASKAHTKTYYEVECDDPREILEEVSE